MSTRLLRVTAIALAALSTGACATGQEWAAWKSHPAHFASLEHFAFSVRNRDGLASRVTRQDVAEARVQSWWGDPVMVTTAQIMER
jgi:hypothetical protein